MAIIEARKQDMPNAHALVDGPDGHDEIGGNIDFCSLLRSYSWLLADMSAIQATPSSLATSEVLSSVLTHQKSKMASTSAGP